MTKSKDLIQRKTLLRTQLLVIERGIAEETGQLDDSNLIKFIKDGVLMSQDGYKLQKLQKNKMALLRVERGLNKQIMMARESERKQALKIAEGAVRKVEIERHRLGEKKHSLLKQVQGLNVQLAALRDPLMVKESEVKPFKHEQLIDTFKIEPGGLEKFLARNYIQNPEQLEKAKREAIEYNKAKFSPGVHPVGHMRSDVVQLFRVTFMKDSGVIVKLEEQGPSVELASRLKDKQRMFLGGDEK